MAAMIKTTLVIIICGILQIGVLASNYEEAHCKIYNKILTLLYQKVLGSKISSNFHVYNQSPHNCIIEHYELVKGEIEFSQTISQSSENFEGSATPDKADRLPKDFLHFTPWNKLNLVIITETVSLEKLIRTINLRATKFYYRDYTVLWNVNHHPLKSNFFEKLKYKIELSPNGETFTSTCFYCRNGEPKTVEINPATELLFNDYTMNFNRKIVRFVGGLGLPLLMDFSQDPKTGVWSPKSGFMIKPILFHLGEKLNWTLTTRVFKVYGAELPNGSFTGFLNELHEGRADLGLAGQTIHRIRAVHFTVPLYIDSVSFATRIPEAGIKWEAVVQAFKLQTWVLFLCICLFGILPIYVYLFQRVPIGAGILFILRPILDQDLTKSLIPKRTSGKILMIVWIIGTLIIGVAYKSKLTSLMVQPQTASGPSSFDQLASSPYEVILHQVGGALSRNIYSTTSNTFQKLSRRIKPEYNMYNCLRQVYSNKPSSSRDGTACISYKHNILGEIYRNWTNHYGNSPLTMAPAYAFMTAGSYFIPKTAVYRESIEKVVSQLVSAGFGDWGAKEAFGSVLQEGKSWSKLRPELYPWSDIEMGPQQLKLEHVKAAFSLLAFSSGISLMVFIIENLWNTFVHK